MSTQQQTEDLSYHCLPHQDLGNTEERTERMSNLGDGEACCQKLSSGQELIIVHMNLEFQCLTTQDPPKIQSVNK